MQVECCAQLGWRHAHVVQKLQAPQLRQHRAAIGRRRADRVVPPSVRLE